VNAHLQDIDGYAARHWSPGEGTINWTSMFDTLAARAATPRLIIEVRRSLHRIPGAVAAFEARGLAC